jgi:fructose-1,6-bisphosphatase/inositol monophosphatase family enzyme
VRVFDMSASLLLLAETGGIATTIEGEPIGNLRCDLNTRTTLLCAASKELHAEALAILQASR